MNKAQIKNIRNGTLVVLLVLYGFVNIIQPCLKRLTFLLVTTVLTFGLFDDICSAIILSIILSMVFTALCKCNDVVEGLQNKKIEKNKENKEGGHAAADNDGDDNVMTTALTHHSDNFIDYNETMRNNLKNIDMKNIEKMTNETKDLLNTQKQLMKTMNDMAPLMKQGMGLVDMFKKTNLEKK
jgi:uncharacterized membrane protein (DUF106 family)